MRSPAARALRTGTRTVGCSRRRAEPSVVSGKRPTGRGNRLRHATRAATSRSRPAAGRFDIHPKNAYKVRGPFAHRSSAMARLTSNLNKTRLLRNSRRTGGAQPMSFVPLASAPAPRGINAALRVPDERSKRAPHRRPAIRGRAMEGLRPAFELNLEGYPRRARPRDRPGRSSRARWTASRAPRPPSRSDKGSTRRWATRLRPCRLRRSSALKGARRG